MSDNEDFCYENCPWYKDETLPCCSCDAGYIIFDIRCNHPKRIRDNCFPDGCDYPIDKPSHCPLTDEESKDMWI
jgi:hypothetical protein